MASVSVPVTEEGARRRIRRQLSSLQCGPPGASERCMRAGGQADSWELHFRHTGTWLAGPGGG